MLPSPAHVSFSLRRYGSNHHGSPFHIIRVQHFGAFGTETLRLSTMSPPPYVIGDTGNSRRSTRSTRRSASLDDALRRSTAVSSPSNSTVSPMSTTPPAGREFIGVVGTRRRASSGSSIASMASLSKSGDSSESAPFEGDLVFDSDPQLIASVSDGDGVLLPVNDTTLSDEPSAAVVSNFFPPSYVLSAFLHFFFFF